MLSAVVVTFNSAARVGACLDSVRSELPDAEIVVADNASRDETLEVVRGAAPEAAVLELGANIGFGRACNAAAEAANSSHLLFLNPDTTVMSVDGVRLAGLLAQRPFGLVAPALDGEPDRWRAETSWQREYLSQTFGTLRPRELTRHPGKRSAGTWVSAAMLLAARDEFLDVGGFDPRFFLYYEDRDLSRRYREAGLPIATTDALRGSHLGTGSSADDGLRVAPMAWSLLGWIQYVAIHDGDRQAKHAGRAAMTTLRGLELALGLPGSLGWRRARRKRGQLRDLMQVLRERTNDDDRDFCPDALRIVRPLV